MEERTATKRRRRNGTKWRRKMISRDYTDFVFSYVPRKCSATNRIIKAKDHASVQISIAKGTNTKFEFRTRKRMRGESVG